MERLGLFARRGGLGKLLLIKYLKNNLPLCLQLEGFGTLYSKCMQ